VALDEVDQQPQRAPGSEPRSGTASSTRRARPGVDRRSPRSARSQGSSSAGADRYVVTAEQVQQLQRVAGRVLDAGVTADGRDAEQVDLWAGARQRDGDGVVDARVRVDDDRMATRAPQQS